MCRLSQLERLSVTSLVEKRNFDASALVAGAFVGVGMNPSVKSGRVTCRRLLPNFKAIGQGTAELRANDYRGLEFSTKTKCPAFLLMRVTGATVGVGNRNFAESMPLACCSAVASFMPIG